MTNNYTCVTSVDGIKKYIGEAKVISFDYETAPNDEYRNEDKAALDAHKAHIVGCSFSVNEGTGIYVPVAHKVGTNIEPTTFDKFLRAFLTDKSIIKVAHNLAFESQMSYGIGVVIMPPVYDTIAASQMTLKSPFEFRKLGESGLKKLAAELCGEPLPSFTDVTDGRHFDELDPQDSETVRYGAADSDYTLRLYRIFNAWFDRFLPKHRTVV